MNRDTTSFAFQGSETSHHPTFPEAGQQHLVAVSGGRADNFPGLADPVGKSVSTSQCAQILHALRLRPQERVSCGIAWEVRTSDDLTSVVEPVCATGETKCSTKTAQVQHLAVFP